ncbi:MAG: InlB B-repeat-containing protein [Clostridia bacterium]|nr:InlB B-repeat-containing protein [Clostridia bacterium]
MKANLLKITTIFLVSLLIVLTVCSCGGGGEAPEKYTVVFKNYNGAILSEQEVDSGAGAQAPSNPTRNGYLFNGWDSSFDCITADTEITATFVPDPNAIKHTVTFKNEDGSVISSVEVIEGNSAQAPSAPQKTGADFIGWNGVYTNVTKSEDVVAVYSDSSNVFKLSSTTGSVGDTVKIKLSLDGSVSLCAFSLSISYDKNMLKLVNYNNELSVYTPMVNPEKDSQTGSLTEGADGKINLAYASSANKTVCADIIELEFEILLSSYDATSLTVAVNGATEISNQEQHTADTTTTSSTVIFK